MESAIKYPVVKLGGVEYTLKWNFLAEIKADELRVDVQEFFSSMRVKGAGKASTFIKLFAAMVAHQFVAAGETIPSPEHWAGVVDAEPDGAAAWREMTMGVSRALQLKMEAVTQKLREARPESAPLN